MAGFYRDLELTLMKLSWLNGASSIPYTSYNIEKFPCS
jgi:hypothetical protein